jgi:CAAX prenyl protease-like protein
MSSPPSSAPSGNCSAPRQREQLVEHHPWLTYLLPFAVFLLAGALEPKPPAPGQASSWLSLPYGCYPLIYTIKIALTLAAMWFVAPGYRKFPPRVTILGILIGLVGIVVWIGLTGLQWEQRLLPPLGLGWLVDAGARSAFDPFKELRAYPAGLAWGFLAIRFFGLVVVVPVIEEFFLRGFLMRFVMDREWWTIPFGKVNLAAVVMGTVFPMLLHPAELLAAAVWFSLVTFLMVKTKSLWDCVAAHAITNLLLGVYVVTSGQWRLM